MVKQTQRPVKPTETSELFLVRGTLPNAARFSNCATIHKVVFGEESEALSILKGRVALREARGPCTRRSGP